MGMFLLKSSAIRNTLVLLFLLPLFFLSPVYAADAFANCGGCHHDTVENIKQTHIVHAPFTRGDCSQCHLVGRKAAPEVKKSDMLREVEQREKIDWFREVRDLDSEHWLLIPESRADKEIYLKLWDGINRPPLKALTLPPLKRLKEPKKEQQPPVISDVVVTEVRRGINTSATIRWQTDEFTDAEILYGRQGLTSSTFDKKLTRQHQAVLGGLEKNAGYQVQIVCRDIHGNQAKSAIFNFKTDKTFIEPAERRVSNRFAGQEISLDWEFYRLQNNYLIVFKSDRAMSLSYGVERKNGGETTRKTKQPMAATGGGHPLLKSQLDTNITLCYSCHGGFKGVNSHPVNVLPNPGMKIPAEYPLLADGRLSCMSCHVNHGGNYAYRLIKQTKKELCLGCHPNY